MKRENVEARMRSCHPDPLAIGAGLFLRADDFLEPELASELGHVAIPVDVRGKNANRDRDWYRNAKCAVLGWSWFTTDPGEFREAIQFTASVGGVAFIVNGEKELRGRSHHPTAKRIVDVCRSACDDAGIALGLVSYSVPQTVRDFPWQVFAEACDFGMPEIYDREGQFDRGYPHRAVEGYEKAGFRRVLTACGVYQRDHGGPWRWRTDAEIERHLDLFPEDPYAHPTLGPARTAWTLGGKVPARVVRGLVRAVRP